MTGVDKPLSNQIIYKVDIKEDKANHVGYSLQYHLISIITVASKKEEYTLKEEEVSSLSTSLDVILRDTYDRLTRTVSMSLDSFNSVSRQHLLLNITWCHVLLMGLPELSDSGNFSFV